MLSVRVVVPEGEIWAGPAQEIIAKTLDGDIGLLTGHSPVLGILAPGSVVRILPQDQGMPAGQGWVTAAVGGGFLSIADDKVSILARQAILGADVDTAATRTELASAQVDAAEDAQIAYLLAQLRAAGENV